MSVFCLPREYVCRLKGQRMFSAVPPRMQVTSPFPRGPTLLHEEFHTPGVVFTKILKPILCLKKYELFLVAKAFLSFNKEKILIPRFNSCRIFKWDYNDHFLVQQIVYQSSSCSMQMKYFKMDRPISATGCFYCYSYMMRIQRFKKFS